MSSVLSPIWRANRPSNDGRGFLALVTTHSGEFFRGAVCGEPRQTEQIWTLKLDLWEAKRNGGGPIGVSEEIAVPNIKDVEIEW
jgi:hypothetical protein